MQKKSFVFLSILSLFGLMLSPFGALLSVQAANVIGYVDLTQGSGPHAPATITSAPEVAVSTADEFYFSFTRDAGEYAGSETITLAVPAGFSSVVDCAVPTDDVDEDTTNDVLSITITGNAVIGWQVDYLLDAVATTTASTGGVELCIGATSPATEGNYSWSVSDGTDAAAALVYVGDDNDVTVSATVPATLSLRIKEETTTTDTNVCDLGVLNPASVNSCAYRIAAGTNNSTGMEVYVLADGVLSTGAGGAGDTVDDAAGGDTIIAGDEEHGIRVTLGTGFTVGGSFSETNDEAVPGTETLILDAAAAVDDSSTANWSTVTHYASVNSATVAGSYEQIVTYRAWLQT